MPTSKKYKQDNNFRVKKFKKQNINLEVFIKSDVNLLQYCLNIENYLMKT